MARARWLRSPSGDVASEATTGRTRAFTYDGVGRLWRTVEGATTRTYSYDANSNRCATGRASATDCSSPTYVYDNADRLTSSPAASGYTYDAHGNLTSAAPSIQPGPDSLNQALSFDAFTSTTPQSFPIVVGQSGSLSSNLSWSSTTPVTRSGTETGSIAWAGTWSKPLLVDGQSYVGSSLTWTQGQHQVSANPSGSVSAGGTSSQTIAPTAVGTISASLDWNPTTTSQTWNSSVANLGTSEQTITASASGTLSASLTWPSALPTPIWICISSMRQPVRPSRARRRSQETPSRSPTPCLPQSATRPKRTTSCV